MIQFILQHRDAFMRTDAFALMWCLWAAMYKLVPEGRSE